MTSNSDIKLLIFKLSTLPKNDKVRCKFLPEIHLKLLSLESMVVFNIGIKWEIVFDASKHESGIIYTTNLNTGIQYKYSNDEQYWTRSFDGLYPAGTWRLDYN